MYFDKGDKVGEMHGHQPSQNHSSLVAFGYETKAIIEIEDQQASIIASSAGVPSAALKRDGKQAYVVASNDDQVVVLYFYDSSFFLTTLTTATPNG